MRKYCVPGDWVAIWVHLFRQLGFYQTIHTPSTFGAGLTLESLKLNNLWSFWWPSCIISYGIYFLIGGFIHVSSLIRILQIYKINFSCDNKKKTRGNLGLKCFG